MQRSDVSLLFAWARCQTNKQSSCVWFEMPGCSFWHNLAHWGRVTHICVSKLTIIGSDTGLSPGRRQAIIWTNAGILLIRPLGTNFSQILSEIHAFSFKNIHLNISSGKWQAFCLCLNVLMAVRERYGFLFYLHCLLSSLDLLSDRYHMGFVVFNSLTPGRFGWDFREVIFKLHFVIAGWGISNEVAIRWMSLDFADDKSTLVQVMAWCHQAPSHYLSRCWPRSLSPYGITSSPGAMGVNLVWSDKVFFFAIYCSLCVCENF